MYGIYWPTFTIKRWTKGRYHTWILWVDWIFGLRAIIFWLVYAFWGNVMDCSNFEWTFWRGVGSSINPTCFLFIDSGGRLRKIRTYIHLPRTQLTSILEGQPSKTRPFSFKTRVIWVPGGISPPYIRNLWLPVATTKMLNSTSWGHGFRSKQPPLIDITPPFQWLLVEEITNDFLIWKPP